MTFLIQERNDPLRHFFWSQQRNGSVAGRMEEMASVRSDIGDGKIIGSRVIR